MLGVTIGTDRFKVFRSTYYRQKLSIDFLTLPVHGLIRSNPDSERCSFSLLTRFSDILAFNISPLPCIFSTYFFEVATSLSFVHLLLSRWYFEIELRNLEYITARLTVAKTEVN